MDKEYIEREAGRMGEWISVKDRLPENNKKVLCCYYFGERNDMPFISTLDYYATDEMPHFQHTLGNENMHVTHWMPLPEPPRDGGGEAAL